MDKQNSSVTLSRSIIPITSALVAWSAVAFSYVDRHYLYVPQTHDEYVQTYGVHVADGISYSMTVDTKLLLQYKDAYRLALIIRVPYADRDRMTDTIIEKSDLYTITGGSIVVAHHRLIF